MESLLEKAKRLNIEPATPVAPTETLLQKAQRLGVEPKKGEPGYFKRVFNAYDQARQEIGSGIREGASDIQQGDVLGGARAGLRTTGAFAKSVFAPILEAPGIKQATEFVVGKSLENEKVASLVTEATKLAEKYPQQAKDIEDVLNIVSLGYAPKASNVLSKEGKAIASDIRQASKIALNPTEEAIQSDIVEMFTKSIKPTAKKTIAQTQRYENDVVGALKTIKANADDLNIEDEFGEIIVGRTPTSINELAQAVDRTKTLVFNQYNDIATRAGGQGAIVDTKPVIGELLKVSQNRALQITNPEVIRYAEGWAKRLEGLGELDTQTAQEIIKNLNNSLKSFYRNPTYESASKASVDAGIANIFRRELDSVIQNTTGEEYQALKNQYSALSAIENDVVRAATRDARKNVKGLLDYTDIFTGGQMVGGILSLNPAMFTKGAIERGFKEYIKFLNDPNRAIGNMFDLLDTSEIPPQSFQPTSKTIQYIQNPKLGLSIEDVSKRKGGDLTTKFLEYAKGKTLLSKQEIMDFARRPELKKGEADLLLKKLDEFEPKGGSDYVGLHKAPVKEGHAPAYDLSLEGIYPKDIYSDPNASRYYGHGTSEYLDKKAVDFVRSIKDKPDAKITIYRAVPNDPKITKINEGDWVTPIKEYAEEHGLRFKSLTNKAKTDFKILEKKVKASDIFTDGNSIYEFGYSPIQGTSKLPAQDFADSIRRDLLELKPVKVKEPQYRGTTINSSMPDKSYEEVVFESPITTNGSSHFPNSKNYFAHARGDEVVEGGKKIWREQEIQSDLLQKDKLANEMANPVNALQKGSRITYKGKEAEVLDPGSLQNRNVKLGFDDGTTKSVHDTELKGSILEGRTEELSKLSPFTNDRFGERIMRERIREKAQKGYSKYRLPTGETIGKIEGFRGNEWLDPSARPSGVGLAPTATVDNLKIGKELINETTNDRWIITDILGDGRFKAVPKSRYELKTSEVMNEKELAEMKDAYTETFDLTGKSNPQYRRYEQWGKFLKNKYGGKAVTDPQGNSWVEIDLKKEMGKLPVEAFGVAPLMLEDEE
jgi:hypothetical protein